jgi:hypothetical protein
MPIAGWMALAWLAAWVIDIALYLAGMKALAFQVTSLLVVISIPWVLLTVVVSFFEMRRATRKAGKQR